MPSTTIGVLLRCEHQEFQDAQAAAAREAGAKAGVDVEVVFGENSPFVQIPQVLAFVNRPPERRPRALVLEVLGIAEGFRTAARAALSAGMGWVEVSGLAPSIPDLRAEFPGKFVMSVCSAEEEIGRLHAAQCLALLPAGGSILYLEGPGLQAEVKARRQGFHEGIRGSAVTIAKTLSGAWTFESGEKAIAGFLASASGSRFTPALVCAQNDEMAVGARRAALARHPEWAGIPFLGCDGVPSGGLKYVKDGVLRATVVKPVTAGVGVKSAALGALQSAPPRDVVLHPESVPSLEALRAG